MAKPHRKMIPSDEAACLRKVRYTTELAARMGAQAALTNPAVNPPEVMFVYCCYICKGWHCTKNEQKDSPAVTKRELFSSLSTARTGG